MLFYAGAVAMPERSVEPARGRRLLRLGFVVVAAALGVFAVWSYRHSVVDAVQRMNPVLVVPAFAAVVVSVGLAVLAWRVALADLGSRLRPRDAARVFCIGQLGKYVPGSVWPVLAQMELARDHGVPRRRTAVASLVAMATSLLVALLVAAVTIPLSGSGRLAGYWWGLLAVPVLLAVLHPAVLNRLLRLPLVRARAAPALRFSGAGVAVVGGWNVLMWLALGLQLWVLCIGLGAPVTRSAGLAIGGFALAWAVGFIVVIAPAGAGAREAVLVAVLSPVLPAGPALVAALLSRVLMTLTDLCLAGLFLLLHRPDREPAEPVTAGDRP